MTEHETSLLERLLIESQKQTSLLEQIALNQVKLIEALADEEGDDPDELPRTYLMARHAGKAWHSQARAPTTAKHQPAEQRGNSTERGYGYRWQQSRAGYLRKHPLCVHCAREGRVEPATELDHITLTAVIRRCSGTARTGRGLCHTCHSRKTATEDGGFGNARRR